MSRVQLALTVSDLETAVDFYSRLFSTSPAKRRPGYANFTITDPPLKLVLIQGPARRAGGGGALNHLWRSRRRKRSSAPRPGSRTKV